MRKIRNAILNSIWGLGYLAMGEKILGIGLIISLPFFHWPWFVGQWMIYLIFPFNLVLVGHVLLTIVFMIDAYNRTDSSNTPE